MKQELQFSGWTELMIVIDTLRLDASLNADQVGIEDGLFENGESK